MLFNTYDIITCLEDSLIAMNLFGKKPDPNKKCEQELRQTRRDLMRNKAELEREQVKIEQQIKAAARSNNKELTRALAQNLIRGAMDPKKAMEIMKEFQKQNMMMEQSEEMMNDVLADMFDVDESEEDAVVNRVLDELGIETGRKLADAPAPSSNLPSSSRDKVIICLSRYFCNENKKLVISKR
ncbi:Charged multivesicular body protein 2b [Cichlidogyrus casuarinus]|uniref:Charged multivesicular body protein 2b n=1 Tax=Cichlidogyrus casuarinus TaxID=1844966 RepID=A0ABD2QKL7_9PLAT